MGYLTTTHLRAEKIMAEQENVQEPTEQNAVSPQAEAVAKEIIEDNNAKAAEPTGEQQVETKPVVPEYESILRDFVGKEQGRIADTFGRKADELEQRVISRVDSALKPYQELMQKQEQAHIETLDETEQIDYWKGKAMQTEEPVQAEQSMSPEQSILAQEVQSMVNQSGANISIGDTRLWQGYNQGMSVGQSIRLAEQNLRRLTTPAPANPAPTPSSQPNTAPTTQGAPQRTAKSVNTLSDAATLFADGNINSAQYRDIKKQLKQGGSATL